MLANLRQQQQKKVKDIRHLVTQTNNSATMNAPSYFDCALSLPNGDAARKKNKT